MVYFARRTLYVLVTVVGVVTISFFLLRAAPGDPILMMFDFSEEGGVSEEILQDMRRMRGLDLPVLQQYVMYVSSVARGDLGRTMRGNRPVTGEIIRNLPPTLALAVAGLTVAVVIGVVSGILAALYRDTWIDYAVTAFAMFSYSAPNFWLGILLLYLFSYVLGWFPILDVRGGNIWNQLHVLVLPALTIGGHSAAVIARMMRSTLLDVLGLDYVRTAAAKGLRPSTVVYKHALRNASLPVVTVAGLSFASLLGGSVVVEVVFARNGLGRLVVDSVFMRDYTLVQGTILFLIATVILVNLLLDFAYAFLDPRIRYD